jgi:hypothetical protein
MMYRLLSLAALVGAILVAAPALAAKPDAEKTTHLGKVVSIADDKLVMTGKDGKEHEHALNSDVKTWCDGKVCKNEDIKTGMKIRVTTTMKDDKATVTKIEALDKNEEFEKLEK